MRIGINPSDENIVTGGCKINFESVDWNTKDLTGEVDFESQKVEWYYAYDSFFGINYYRKGGHSKIGV